MPIHPGKLSLALSLCVLLSACGGEDGDQQSATEAMPEQTAAENKHAMDNTAMERTKATESETPDEATGNQTGDAANGEKLYKQPTISGVPGCMTCHSLEPGIRMVGPSLANIATIAAEAVDGMSAEEFIRQSITDPNAHITEGFSKGLMYQNYEKQLSQQQIDDLVAFLLTLE